MKKTEITLVHSPHYAEWIFDPTHPTQGRRFTNARNLLLEDLAKDGFHTISELEARNARFDELELVHSPDYVDQVVAGYSNEWVGVRKDMGEIAQIMAGATIQALEELMEGRTKLAVNFAGAKHHAGHNYSSGFCIYADFAIASAIATAQGHRVAIFDCDVHHGDGTEYLTADNPNVMSFSVHEYGIFPGTGLTSIPSKNVFNFPLAKGSGNLELQEATASFTHLAQGFKPDLIFIACGADGLAGDPLGGLNYSIRGYQNAMRQIRNSFPDTPILFGGAGGYLPDSDTPKTWVRAISTLINPLF